MSLSNVFNDVIGQSNQTKTFGSGLNQKRFSGKVTATAISIGATKGIGSSSRVVNNCKLSSEEPTQCITQVLATNIIAAQKAPQIVNTLFDISSFSKRFDLYKDGISESYASKNQNFSKLEQKYIDALLNAAKRWNSFIKFRPETFKLINDSISYKMWNGIELYKAVIQNDSSITYIAETQSEVIKSNTTLVYRFGIKINYYRTENYNSTQLLDVFTHELGHALGMPCFKSLKNGSGEEVLPLLFDNSDINAKCYVGNLYVGPGPPQLYNKEYDRFPKALEAYNEFPGRKIKPQQKNIKAIAIVNNLIPLFTDSKGRTSHWCQTPLYDNVSNFIYQGFDNEIMVPYYDGSKRMLISKLTIGELLDMYTSLNNTKYYNYIEINTGSSEVTSHNGKTTTTDIITLNGSSKSFTQNDFSRKFIHDKPILICVDCS